MNVISHFNNIYISICNSQTDKYLIINEYNRKNCIPHRKCHDEEITNGA